MNNHETLVRQIAEEMSKAKTDEERARIAVKYMAETYKQCRMQFCEYDDHVPGWAIEDALHSEMEERGLIPPAETGKEAAGDE